MCGIAGVLGVGALRGAALVAESKVMMSQLAHRGPDGSGLWLSSCNRCALAHTRLAILDLSAAGAQPMLSEDGMLAITFNGEIYNYLELRERLERRGVVFRSHSDTEVLLHAYRTYGREFVNEIQGMYAFALWDSSSNTALLARDPYGIKPLYFLQRPDRFSFASEVNAILAVIPERQLEPAAQVGFLLWGHVPQPWTMWKGIRSLDPGTLLVWHDGKITEERQFWSLRCVLSRIPVSARRGRPEGIPEACRIALNETVGRHLLADVPIAVFLSAGKDSTSLLGMCQSASRVSLSAFTLGFGEYANTLSDEVPIASTVANTYGVPHHVARTSVSEAKMLFANFLRSMDQPTLDGFNTYLICDAAHRHGLKAVLSGLGADELLGGYPSFTDVPRLVSGMHRIPKWLRQTLALGRRPLQRFGLHPKLAGIPEYGNTLSSAYLLKRCLFLPWEIEAIVGREIFEEGWTRLRAIELLEDCVSGVKNEMAKLICLESTWYMGNQLLRDSDWCSMAHSIELRVPFVDSRLTEAFTEDAVAGMWTKDDLTGAPSTPLPTDVRKRPKTGFQLPLGHWFPECAKFGQATFSRNWAMFILDKYMRGHGEVHDAR